MSHFVLVLVYFPVKNRVDPKGHTFYEVRHLGKAKMTFWQYKIESVSTGPHQFLL